MHHASDEPVAVQMNRQGSRRAEAMLVLSTLVWGASFAPAREAGEISNAALGLSRSAVGPIASLGVRFLFAALLWFALVWLIRIVRRKFPRPDNHPSHQSKRSPASLTFSKRRATRVSAAVGLLLAIGIMVQHIALDFLPVDRAESVAAFLTSLTVITVPLTLWLIWRDRPTWSLALAIVLAVAGVWLMTRPAAAIRSPANSGIESTADSVEFVGVGFGILCAIVFAFHIIAVNAVASRISMSRLNGVQFIVAGVFATIVALVMMASTNHWPTWPIMNFDRWLLNLVFLMLGPTILSYTLMVIYQPQVSPVRAAIIYMLEPVFATLFAWMWSGKELGRIAVVGASLILLANVVAEIGPRIRKKNFP